MKKKMANLMKKKKAKSNLSKLLPVVALLIIATIIPICIMAAVDTSGDTSSGSGDTNEQRIIGNTSSISGKLWHDANENGACDVGEQPIANDRVYLCMESDSITAVDAIGG